MTDKIFCGSARIIKTNYGEMVKLTFREPDLAALQSNLNEKGFVSALVKEKREPKEGKPTHYIEVDTWKPEPKERPQLQQPGEDDEPLPF